MDASDSYEKFARPMDRSLVQGVWFAAAAAGALTAKFPEPALAAVRNADILNFTINLEYLTLNTIFGLYPAEGCPAGTPWAPALRGQL
jgi:hypothetical protein